MAERSLCVGLIHLHSRHKRKEKFFIVSSAFKLWFRSRLHVETELKTEDLDVSNKPYLLLPRGSKTLISFVNNNNNGVSVRRASPVPEEALLDRREAERWTRVCIRLPESLFSNNQPQKTQLRQKRRRHNEDQKSVSLENLNLEPFQFPKESELHWALVGIDVVRLENRRQIPDICLFT